jgi:hypothetical protein
MYKILEDFQVLATGFLAIVAASIGFAGVRYAQRKTLENAEQERRHREDMARNERNESDKHLLLATISALSGELMVMHERVGKMRAAASYVKKQHQESGLDRATIPGDRILFPLHTPIFDTHLEKIGVLPASLSFSVARAYSLIKTFSTVPQYREELPTSALISAYSISIKILEETGDAILDTVMRLHAVRQGHPDPGIGKGEEFWKDRGDPERF